MVFLYFAVKVAARNDRDKKKENGMKMKKLLVLAMVMAMAGAASAARNYILNGGFEDSFYSTDSSDPGVTNYFDGNPGDYAYGADLGNLPTNPSFIPGNWGDYGQGYVWNPVGSEGTNHYGYYVGLTNVANGNGAYGAFGGGTESFSLLQNIRTTAQEGDTIILSWDMNFLSADEISEIGGGYFTGNLQFIGSDTITTNFPHDSHTEPLDTWNHYSITQAVTAAQADHVIQIHFTGAGVWVDDVTLQILRPGDDNLIANGSFEHPFTGGYGTTLDGTPGSYAYGGYGDGTDTIPAFCPHWNGELNVGYAWNPSGTGGTNHWGTYVGLTNASDGVAAYGAWGGAGHSFSLYQYTGEAALEGDVIIFSWDANFLSADEISGIGGGYLNTHLQFVGVDQISTFFDYDAHTEPLDTWNHYSITQTVTAAQSTAGIQIHMVGAGVWIDNVSVKLLKNYEGWIFGYGLTGADADPDYDFEPDGVANFLEYAFGGDPTNPDATAIQPTYEFTAGTAEYVYRRRLDAAARGLAYDLFLNTNGLVAGSWDYLGSTFESNGVVGANFESVTNTIPVTGSEGFIKQEITEY